MLIRYKKNQEKIAMGLLSFMPEDNDVKSLQETIKQYETNENWHLYLWKYDDDIVGIVGIKIENELNVIVQHISVNPSFRNMGIGRNMIEAIINLYGEKYDVGGNEATELFFQKCQQDHDK